MSVRVAAPAPAGCPWCASHQHRRCLDASAVGPCACAETNHRPSDEVAAAMRLYHRIDLLGDTVANLAAEYRVEDAR